MAPPPVAEAPAPAAPAAPKLDSLTPPKPPAPIAGAGEKADVPAAPPLEQLARDLEQQAPVAPKVLSKPAEAPAPAGEFTIQMGAFSSKANADRLAAKFKGQDIEAYVASGKDSRGRTLYYVRSGSFDSREKARAAADRVKKVSGSAAIVTRPGKGDIRL
jgi:cell division septation protein DedD